MRFTGRTLSLVVPILFVVLLAPLAVQAADGSIQVTVLEKEGGADVPLIGATVELKNVDGAFQPTGRMTDVNGQVLFPAVPAGSGYIVTAAMPGYGAVVRDGIAVIAGQASQVVVALTAEMREEIEVIGKSEVVDIEKQEQSTTISDEFFGDLPVIGREYQQVLRLAPGFSDTDGDGNPNVHGSRDRDFQMSVDGVNNVDPLTGKFMSFITPDAIEEIEIIDAGADASYGGAVGGYGKMKIKDGGNEFEGTANLFFRDALFDNDLAGKRDPSDFGLIQPSFLLSGPIIKDNLWFLVNHEYLDVQIPVNLVAGTDFIQSRESLRSLDKLTWQFGARSNKLTLQYSADPLKIEPFNVSSVAPPETGTIFEQGGPTFSLKWIAPYSPTLFWETTVSRQEATYTQEPFDRNAVNECVLGNPTARSGGVEEVLNYTNLSCTNNSFAGRRSGAWYSDEDITRVRWTYGIDAEKFVNEWMGGEHRIRFGANMQRGIYSRAATFRDRLSFTSFSGQSSALVGEIGSQPGGLSPLPSSLPPFLLTQFVYGPKPLDIDNAFEGGINPNINTFLNDEARNNVYALYFTDTYTPVNNLFITLGVRYSREEIEGTGFQPFDPRAEREAWKLFLDDCAGELGNFDGVDGLCMVREGGIELFTTNRLDFPRGSGDPTQPIGDCSFSVNGYQCNTIQPALINGLDVQTRTPETFNIINSNLEPRLSVRWDPKNDGKTVVFASWGRYFGETILLPFLSENGPEVSTRIFELGDDGTLPDPTEQPRIGQSAFAINSVDRDLNSQHTDEWTVGFEREIAPETLLRIRYLNRRISDQLQDVDINHGSVLFDSLTDQQKIDCVPLNIDGIDYADCFGQEFGLFLPGETQADGQPDLQVFNPFYSSVYVIGNQNRTKYDAYILELTRRFYQNWEFGGSYVWSKAIGDAEDFADVAGDDVTNQQDRQGFLAFDQRHVVKLNGRIFVPRWGGFRLGGAFSYQTGLPYSIISIRNSLDFPTDLSQGASGISYGRTALQFSTFRQTYPTGERNDQRNSPYWNLDVNFQKDFEIRSLRATFQFEIYNLLNDNTDYIAAKIRSSYLDPSDLQVKERDTIVATEFLGRRFQLGLKLNFD